MLLPNKRQQKVERSTLLPICWTFHKVDRVQLCCQCVLGFTSFRCYTALF